MSGDKFYFPCSPNTEYTLPARRHETRAAVNNKTILFRARTPTAQLTMAKYGAVAAAGRALAGPTALPRIPCQRVPGIPISIAVRCENSLKLSRLGWPPPRGENFGVF